MTEILYRCKRPWVVIALGLRDLVECLGEIQTVKVWAGLLEGDYHFRGKCSKCGEFYYDCDAFGLQRILTLEDGTPMEKYIQDIRPT